MNYCTSNSISLPFQILSFFHYQLFINEFADRNILFTPLGLATKQFWKKSDKWLVRLRFVLLRRCTFNDWKRPDEHAICLLMKNYFSPLKLNLNRNGDFRYIYVLESTLDCFASPWNSAKLHHPTLKNALFQATEFSFTSEIITQSHVCKPFRLRNRIINKGGP